MRAVYDKNGAKMVRHSCALATYRLLILSQTESEGAVNVEDAAGFFANVFGGERFQDYVRAPSFCSDIPRCLQWNPVSSLHRSERFR